ncbi:MULTISPECIES: hypothetical protein [Photobacterium]|uniref:hypothetical protein n=1 Tax=Photobacterium TaxID=657 RepID=UPI001E3B6294|nr:MULTISPECIES: hypothetical protein [Photobacterium]MCD9489177.1 hypothetical protein [Photobacterium iliopiscarium]MCD9531958.1 hypothetical protein [Photobacterium carnosum]MCD9539561.1 hypothetical protein [Photobacterium carnosum]MCF2245852.1 hypothetical protein [Photobacterium iliopiscarium]
MAGKRKAIKVVTKPKTASVEPLSIDDMYIDNGKGQKFWFKRLRYRGVPTLVKGGCNQGEFKNPDELVFANRDGFIREIYRLKPTGSTLTHHAHIAAGLVCYLRYLDEFEPQALPLANDNMERCIKHFNNLKLNGVTPSVSKCVRDGLVYILKQLGRESDARNLPEVAFYEASGKQGALDIETELKPIGRILTKGYRALVQHIKNDTHPEIHPFFDEALLNEMNAKQGWKGRKVGAQKRAFKMAVLPSTTARTKNLFDDKTLKRVALLNQTSRCALQLFFMLTGMNDSVLKGMKRSDVKFKTIGSGHYVFDGIKGRAGHKQVDNSLGFSKYTKQLIEDWLEVSKAHFVVAGIDDIDNQPLIPYFNTNHEVKDFNLNGSNPSVVNSLIGKLLACQINSSRFRKTKSDILMRVTEDVYLVSQGLNNTVNVVTRSYSGGVEADHNRNLSAMMETQAQIGRGESIAESIKNAKVLHSDILSDYDHKERLKRHEIPTTTIAPHGIRCTGDSSKTEQIARKLKNLDIGLVKNEKKCTAFLECFDCESHALIASESDIWLMLSFYEQVTEMKEIPAQNSIPKEKLYEIEAILSRTLKRFEQKAPEQYASAKEKMEISPHPLFANLRGLVDTLEVFNV